MSSLPTFCRHLFLICNLFLLYTQYTVDALVPGFVGRLWLFVGIVCDNNECLHNYLLDCCQWKIADLCALNFATENSNKLHKSSLASVLFILTCTLYSSFIQWTTNRIKERKCLNRVQRSIESSIAKSNKVFAKKRAISLRMEYLRIFCWMWWLNFRSTYSWLFGILPVSYVTNSCNVQHIQLIVLINPT